jgi:predicted transposase YbfD/YdcC
MPTAFLALIEEIDDPRIAGMVTYPLDEMLLSALVGVLCGADDFDDVVDIGEELVDWLRRLRPFAHGIAPAQTLRRVFRLLEPQAFERVFMTWAASLAGTQGRVVAIDGKTLKASKQARDGGGALHLVQAYLCEAGLTLGQRPVAAKSNEITAIPPLLELLALKGAIVTIDAMGTQTEIAAAIVKRGADYVLALKGNQSSLQDDVQRFFADAELTKTASVHRQAGVGHGRIEERTCMAADAAWLAERHPAWRGLNSIAALTSVRTDKKTGEVSRETRSYITSLPADAALILNAVRSHWAIENCLHWQLDVGFDEDRCRLRKDHAARNFALIRRTALNMLKREPSKTPIKRKRLRALMNHSYRAKLLEC